MNSQKPGAGLALLLAFMAATQAQAEVRIAVAGPMKGEFAAFGEQMQAGAEQAVADLNASGGVNGEKLVLEVADDACVTEQAVAVANQLVGAGVVFVAGHLCFNGSIPASAVYDEAGIVQISPGTTLPKFTDEQPGEGTFRLAPRDDRQAEVLGRYLAGEFSGRRIALLHDKTAYGKGLTDAVKAVMNGLGARESMALGFDTGSDDFRSLVSQMRLENIDAVFLGGYHPEAGLIKLEMDRQGLDAVLIGGDALMTEDYWTVTGDAGAGTLLTYPEIPREIPEAAGLVARMEEAGMPVERYALTTYAAIQAWAEAAEMAESFAFGEVSAALRTGSFNTVIGPVAFDANGDSNVPDYILYEWRDGAPRPKEALN